MTRRELEEMSELELEDTAAELMSTENGLRLAIRDLKTARARLMRIGLYDETDLAGTIDDVAGLLKETKKQNKVVTELMITAHARDRERAAEAEKDKAEREMWAYEAYFYAQQ